MNERNTSVSPYYYYIGQYTLIFAKDVLHLFVHTLDIFVLLMSTIYPVNSELLFNTVHDIMKLYYYFNQFIISINPSHWNNVFQTLCFREANAINIVDCKRDLILLFRNKMIKSARLCEVGVKSSCNIH